MIADLKFSNYRLSKAVTAVVRMFNEVAAYFTEG